MSLEQKLGFDIVRRMLTAKCSTSYARNRVEEETISTKEDIISHRLLLTDEMRLICMFEDSFPSGGFVDAKGFLITLRSDYSYIDLPSLGLLRTMLGTLKRVTAFFNGSKDGLYPNLKKMSEPVSFYPEIARRIDLILDKAGDVRDNASENLALIRRSLKDKESSIMRRIGAILRQAQVDGIADEDAAVSVRDGKTLIPISAANKKKIAGIVYDESSSGKTAFIEPLEVVELNNQVRALRFEEQREIMRILAEFTDFLRPYLDDLVSSAEYLGEIDFIRAKALVAMDMIAGMPIISKNGELSLRKARHPLLETALRKERKEIVPLNLFLNKEKHILLISGPNAGGKSVCLKTVGLLQYMFQWGMLIPTSEVSEMTIFNNIFIDIGDDQSIENDLSTYSSHLTNMKNIVIRADARSLVLIDEFGGGTEPAAGGAIAEAVLAELDKAGAYGVITTHYTNLKLYADSSRGVVNGAMLFDTAAIAPLFKLEQGLPGNSFAFELARKIGLPEAIIKSAEERAGNDFVDMERQLRKIARNRRALDEKLTRIKATDKTLEGLTDKYQKELSEIKALKKSIIEDARREAKEILSGANRQIEQTIREIRESQAEKTATKEARATLAEFAKTLESDIESETDKKINEKIEKIVARKERERKRKEERDRKRGIEVAQKQEQSKSEDAPLKVGDKVKIKDSDMIGEVTEISSKKVTVAIGTITSKVELSKIERISENQFDKSKKQQGGTAKVTYSGTDVSQLSLHFSPSIDIRGERLTDALDIITHFIDNALMVGMHEVSILHGKGNGILREEIRKYLKITPGVVSFRDEALNSGGSGLTIVTLE